MPLDVTIQLSRGRFIFSVDENESIRAAKKRMRSQIPEISHMTLVNYRANVNGSYLSDESKTVKACGISEGDVVHFVKKACCPASALDTEKKSEE